MATSDTRCLSICSGVRTNCFSRRSIKPRPQFLPRMVKPMIDNIRIEGSQPISTNISGGYGVYAFERNYGSLSSCLQHWKADICPDLKPKPKPKPDIFVNYHDDNKEYFVAYSLKEDGTISPKYHIYPLSFLEKDYSFTGASCNGLFHFHDKKSGHVLWNPTTGEHKTLPEPFVEPHLKYACQSFGMWFDHRFDDYKVLNLVHARMEDEQGYFLGTSYHIDLYSLKTNSWKRIPCTEICGIEEYSCASVCGAFYCKAYLKEAHAILSFDFSTETFSILPSPNNSWHSYYFLEYKGLLSALECFYMDSYYAPNEIPMKYELWIMSDGSWTRESEFHIYGVREPLWFSLDCKLLYFSSMNDELVVFDRATIKMKHLGIDCSTTNRMVIPFFESFVQLN